MKHKQSLTTESTNSILVSYDIIYTAPGAVASNLLTQLNSAVTSGLFTQLLQGNANLLGASYLQNATSSSLSAFVVDGNGDSNSNSGSDGQRITVGMVAGVTIAAFVVGLLIAAGATYYNFYCGNKANTVSETNATSNGSFSTSATTAAPLTNLSTGEGHNVNSTDKDDLSLSAMSNTELISSVASPITASSAPAMLSKVENPILTQNEK